MNHCPYCALAKWACPRHGEDSKKTKRFLTPEEMEERKSHDEGGGWEVDYGERVSTTFYHDGTIVGVTIETPEEKSDATCTQCKSQDAVYEEFNDDEAGHIFECRSCNYTEVYREDVDSGEVVEDYSGYEHYYRKEREG